MQYLLVNRNLGLLGAVGQIFKNIKSFYHSIILMLVLPYDINNNHGSL